MKVKKPRKQTASSVRNQADKLLTPLIIKMYPKCLLCNNPTQVAHHHIHKSKSTRLRYEINNLVPLCHSCHLALHMNESYHASRIVEIRGLDWFRDLERMKNEIVKADVLWYSKQLGKLRILMEKLSTP